MAEEAKDSLAAVADIVGASRASRAHSSQLLKHQSKDNDRRHRSLLVTNSQLHSKEAGVMEEPNSNR